MDSTKELRHLQGNSTYMTQYQHYETAKNPIDEHITKPDLWRPLARAIDGFDVDPAAARKDCPIADTCYTESDDGLSFAWHGKVWLNPPFSEKIRWYKKLINEVNCGNADLGIAVAPVDTSTDWFQDWFSNAAYICFLNKRDWYLTDGSPSFNTAVGVFGGCPDSVLDVLNSKGTITEVQYQPDTTTISDYE